MTTNFWHILATMNRAGVTRWFFLQISVCLKNHIYQISSVDCFGKKPFYFYVLNLNVLYQVQLSIQCLFAREPSWVQLVKNAIHLGIGKTEQY